jgi:[acyl-carrier-protein] S-malonyltransferase
MLDSAKTALIFPGQGSQEVGMGADLATQFRVARQTFEEADDILGFALSELCFNGPEQELTNTINAQPALYVAGIATLRTVYEALGDTFRPACVAGHSLGELTALTAAGSLDFPAGLKLVRKRGELMAAADQHSPGGMAAILGLDTETVDSICDQAHEATQGVAVVANDNCPGQTVIAGDEETLGVAMELAGEAGARKVVRLAVSIASHSPLMARVADEFRTALEDTPFRQPMIPIVGNTGAQPLQTEQEIRTELGDQLTSRVRWTESVQAMLSDGMTTFVELGSKDVLTSLLKRIDRSTTRFVVDDPDGVASLSAEAG